VSNLSTKAKTLIAAYAAEVSDAREWRNEENVKRTLAALSAYLSALEQYVDVRDLSKIQDESPLATPAFSGGGL